MKIGIFIWIIHKLTLEWALTEEALTDEVLKEGASMEGVSTEEKCAKNLIEEWILTEGMNLKEEVNSTEDMILTQDFLFGGYYSFNNANLSRATNCNISW